MGNMESPAGWARDAGRGLLLLLLPLHGELASHPNRTGRKRLMTWCAKLRWEWIPMQASGCGGGGACLCVCVWLCVCVCLCLST